MRVKTYPDDPINPVSGSAYKHEDGGCLTKREYFSAQALMGMLIIGKGYDLGTTAKEICKGAVQMADAIIEELNK